MRGWIIGLLAGALTVAGWAAPPPSVLPNSGFEDGLTGWTVTPDATAQAGGAAGVIDTVQPLAGAKVLKLTLPGKGTISAVSNQAPVQAGRDYLITARYRSDGFNAPGKQDVGAYLYLTWLGADGKTLVTLYHYGFSPQAQAKWVGVSRLVIAPEGAAAVQVTLALTSTQGTTPSSIWCDQVQVRRWDGAVKPGGTTWRYIPAVEGYYDSRQFRAVADDTTKSGLAVIANPKFAKGGYLSAYLYLRNFKPGAYRITYRLKVAAPPPPDTVVVTLSSDANLGGPANSRPIRGAEFTAPGVWQEFSLRFVIAPWSEYSGFGAIWAGNTIMSLDTITVAEEEIFTDAHAAELFH